MPVEYGNLLIRFRADHVVVATGTTDQPLVFPGQRSRRRHASRRRCAGSSTSGRCKPGERAVVLTVDDRGLSAIDDLRARPASRSPSSSTFASGGRGRSAPRAARAASGRSPSTASRSTATSSSWQGARSPPTSFSPHAGATVEFDAIARHLRPDGASGTVVGGGRSPARSGRRRVPRRCSARARRMLRLLLRGPDGEGPAVRDRRGLRLDPAREALHDGDDGAVPGQALPSELDPRLREGDARRTRRRSARRRRGPPWSPVSMALLAGRPHDPAKRTSMHHRHKDMGANVFWTGAWRRPHSYGDDPQAEAQKVHESIGIIDVSTLGKILVKGPEAGAFLDRLYPNRFSDLKVGRIRYGILTSDAGRIFDDGTVGTACRRRVLRDDHVDRRRRRLPVVRVVERGLAHGRRVTNLTGAVAAVNVAGPERTQADGEGHATSTSRTRRSRTSTRSTPTSPGVPALILRIGFVGELGYEIHFPSPSRRAPLGHAVRARQGVGRRPVRPRAAADPAPREDAHPRRPGHRRRVESARGGDVVDRQARQGRLRRQVGDRAGQGARPQLDARRLRDAERPGSRRGRPDRRRRKVGRAHHERPLERATRQGDRHGGRSDRARRGRHRRSTCESTAASSRRSCARSRSSTPTEHTCAR